MQKNNDKSIPWIEVFTLILGCFMSILDTSIVSVAMPNLKSILGGNADTVQWVITAYLLVSGVIIPITGFLSDRFGNRWTYIMSVIIFTIGSGACAIATNTSSLIFARVIQAIGGGMIIPISMSIIRMIVPREKMGTAMGVWGIAALGAPAIGPTTGGYIINHMGWQWIFTINLPIGLITVLLAGSVLKETPRKIGLKLDVIGFMLSTATFFSLLLALSKGQEAGWTSLYIVNLIIFSIGSFVLFIIWESYTSDPLIDLHIFKNRTYCVSLLCVCLSNVAMYSIMLLIPLYIQSIRGLSPLKSGELFLPSALVTALMMPISGKLFDKIGTTPLCLVGFSIAAYYSYQLHTLTYYISFVDIQWILVKRSFGFSLAMMAVSTAGMNTIPKNLISRASVVNNLVRQVAGSFGIALTTYIMMHRQDYHSVWFSSTINWSSSVTISTITYLKGMLLTHGVTSSAILAKSGAQGLLFSMNRREAYISGINDALLVPAILVAFIVPLGFLLSRKHVEKENAKQNSRFAESSKQTTR